MIHSHADAPYSQHAYVIDLEANKLYPYQSKVWTIRIKRVGTDQWLRINPFRLTSTEVREKILGFIFEFEGVPIIIGHNYLGFDGWVLWKDFGLEMSVGPDTICGLPVIFFDTLFASQFLLPDREGKHSLKSWGERLGDHKIDYYTLAVQKGYIPIGSPEGTEFSIWSIDMDLYCEQDCLICEKIFLLLNEQIEVEGSRQAFKLGQKNFYLMCAQTFTGFAFDIEKAQVLQPRIEQMISDLKKEVEPQLPPRELKKAELDFYQMPAKPFTKDGNLSANMNKFIEKHGGMLLPGNKVRVNGQVIDIEPHKAILDKLPMELEDQVELKKFFLSVGWSPSLWNYKKDKFGKPIRDEKRQLIKMSPKIQENHQICPNLLELDGELPKKVVKFLSLRNRLGILTGWLKHPRLEWDGRLPAGSSGLAVSHRQTHTVVVNVPKAQDDVLLGKEFRELFTVEAGNKLIGCDQAALEARCEAHWIYKYQPEMSDELINGDLHSKNSFAFFPDEVKEIGMTPENFNKEDSKFKIYRNKSKTAKYAVLYGSAPPKLAKTLGKPEKKGQELFDNFWAINTGLKELKDRIEYFWERKGGKKWIPAIDGRRLHSRSKHSLVNLLFQSTGAIIVDYALCLFDMKMGGLKLDERGRPYYNYKGEVVKRVGYWHDEACAETTPVVAKDVAEVFEWCMAEAGRRLKLNVPTVGESKIGISWDQTH